MAASKPAPLHTRGRTCQEGRRSAQQGRVRPGWRTLFHHLCGLGGGRAGAGQARDAGPWGPSDTVPGAVSGPDHSIRTLWAPVRKALSCPAPWPGHREALLPAADPLHQQGANPPEPARPSVGIHSSNREPLAEWGKPGPGQQGLCLLAEASPGLPQVWLPPCPTLTRSPGATDPR